MDRTQKLSRLLCAWVLGGLFVYSGVIKLLDPVAFMEDILGYRLVGRSLAYWAALVLPAMECILGMAMISGWARRTAAVITAGLLVGFTLAIISAWIRGLDVQCGCFGSSDGPPAYAMWVVRDLVMIGMALWIAVGGKPGRFSIHCGGQGDSNLYT